MMKGLIWNIVRRKDIKMAKVTVEIKKKGWVVKGKIPDVYKIAARMFVAELSKKRNG